eukprot:3101758-Prymnesium_polylepis.2
MSRRKSRTMPTSAPAAGQSECSPFGSKDDAGSNQTSCMCASDADSSRYSNEALDCSAKQRCIHRDASEFCALPFSRWPAKASRTYSAASLWCT